MIGPQSGNNFPRRYDVTHNDAFFQHSVQVRVLKNKVLVHFCTFSCVTFNFEYDFLDISITLNAKVLGYSREVNL